MSTKTLRPNTAQYARRIVQRLNPLEVRKIILFGSRVWGKPHPDSDLDVLVVLAGHQVPQCSAEKGTLYRRVSTPLHGMQREVPMDLVVHTEEMHRRFVEQDSMFARKITQEGHVIYENGG